MRHYYFNIITELPSIGALPQTSVRKKKENQDFIPTVQKKKMDIHAGKLDVVNAVAVFPI